MKGFDPDTGVWDPERSRAYQLGMQEAAASAAATKKATAEANKAPRERKGGKGGPKGNTFSKPGVKGGLSGANGGLAAKAATLSMNAARSKVVVPTASNSIVSTAVTAAAASTTVASTAAAAEAIGRGEFDAAIAAPVAAAHYGLTVIADNIGDIVGAITRFVLVSKPATPPKATGFDRTSLAVFIGIDHAGALLDILTEFAKRDVNLTFIQSRPTGLELGHYHFIIDAEGHVNEAPVKETVEALRAICEDIRFLGSYPREKAGK